MSKIHIGPHTHDEEVDPHPASQTFDREVNLKAIAWTVGLLVAVALVVHVIIYGLIVGFNRFDDKREPELSPVAEANEQQPPPMPRLQTTPEGDLKQYREDEDRLLGQAQWLDQGQGRLRIPIDLAMEIVAGRGLGPEVVGGTPGAVVLVPPAQLPGAVVQMSRQPAQSQTVQQPPAGQTPPPRERR
jgi:hypothetical protein